MSEDVDVANSSGDLLSRVREQNWFGPLARAPTLAWRLGLGALVGGRFLILTTRGRKSGTPRHTMLGYIALEGRPHVFAVYGARSQWLRNAEVDPRVTIQTSAGVQSSTARRIVDPVELGELFERMQRRDAKSVRLYLLSRGLPYERASFTSGDERVAIVTFTPTSEPTPPPLEPDLRWMWSLVPPLVAARAIARRWSR
ncbi:MAG: nitroreductase family deazaflavin-dependent oxidoreductase [Actinomycetota bacterium]